MSELPYGSFTAAKYAISIRDSTIRRLLSKQLSLGMGGPKDNIHYKGNRRGSSSFRSAKRTDNLLLPKISRNKSVVEQEHSYCSYFDNDSSRESLLRQRKKLEFRRHYCPKRLNEQNKVCKNNEEPSNYKRLLELLINNEKKRHSLLFSKLSKVRNETMGRKARGAFCMNRIILNNEDYMTPKSGLLANTPVQSRNHNPSTTNIKQIKRGRRVVVLQKHSLQAAHDT